MAARKQSIVTISALSTQGICQDYLPLSLWLTVGVQGVQIGVTGIMPVLEHT